MKKGFTLIELLAVIVILAIIAVITIPEIQESLYEAKDKAYEILVSRISEKASTYVDEHNLQTQVTSNTTVDVYLSTLVSEGYIDEDDLSDPRKANAIIDEQRSYVSFILINGDVKTYPHFVNVDKIDESYLYNEGENATLWTVGYHSTPGSNLTISMTKETDYLFTAITSNDISAIGIATWSTNKKVHLEGYGSIDVDFILSGNVDQIYISLDPTDLSSNPSEDSIKIILDGSDYTVDETYTAKLNVVGLTGDYYVNVGMRVDAINAGDMSIYKIKLQ